MSDYTRKTTSGKTITIKNNIVYVNGKVASKGYKWYDGQNGTTYLVGGNGSFEPIEVRGKKVLKNFPIFRHSEINPSYEDPSSLPDGPHKIYNAGLKETSRKYQVEERYFVPRNIPGVPSAVVSTGSRFKGVDIPYNLLDSVAKYVHDVPGMTLADGLGLLGETSAGQAPVATILTPTQIRLHLEHPAYLHYQGDRKELGYYPTDLTNNHHYYQDNPFNAYTNTLIRLKKVPGVVGTFHPIIALPAGSSILQKIVSPRVEEDLTLIEQAKYWYPRLEKLQHPYSDNPWIDAFLYLKRENYGMGPSYPSTVRSLGLELLRDPEIIKWRKLSKYTK